MQDNDSLLMQVTDAIYGTIIERGALDWDPREEVRRKAETLVLAIGSF